MVIFSDAFREAKFGEAERILASAMHLRGIVQNPVPITAETIQSLLDLSNSLMLQIKCYQDGITGEYRALTKSNANVPLLEELSNLSNLVSELKIKAASGEVSAVQIAQLEKEVESVKSKVN